jgi:DNA polymerase V
VKIKKIYPARDESKEELPLFYPKAAAGFPSPADDFMQEKLSLNTLLIKNPATTFFVNVEGNSMKGAGIFDGDTLIVDRAVEPEESSIVIASVNGELTVKRIERKRGKLYLVPENNNYPPIEISEETDLKIWGVVIYSIHKF